MCTPLDSNGISIYLLVVIFLPLMILVEVDTERKLPMLPPPPPPKEVEEKEVKPPPPRLPMVVMWPMWPMWPMVLMEPKEPKPEINRTKRDSHLNRWQWFATIGNFLSMCGLQWNMFCIFSFFTGARLTWVERWEASTKGRKTDKASVKRATCPTATRPTLVPPAAAEEWIITKWICTWENRAEKWSQSIKVNQN